MARRPRPPTLTNLTAARDLISINPEAIPDPRERQRFELLQGQLRAQAVEAEKSLRELDRQKAQSDQLRKDLTAARREARTAGDRAAALSAQVAQSRTLNRELDQVRRQNTQLQRTIETRDASITQLQSERRDLDVRIAALQAGAERVAVLDRDLAALRADLAARDALIETLQEQAHAPGAAQAGATKEPKALIEMLHRDLTELSAAEGGAFALDDVEIDLVAPLDVESDRAVMRFNPAALSAPEGASRIRFRLTRNAQIRATDEEAD